MVRTHDFSFESRLRRLASESGSTSEQAMLASYSRFYEALAESEWEAAIARRQARDVAFRSAEARRRIGRRIS